MVTPRRFYLTWHHCIKRNRRKSRDLGLPATLSVRQWFDTMTHFGDKCAYCAIHKVKSVDHFIPKSSGGGTTVSNCLPACLSCNEKKGNRLPHEALPYDLAETLSGYLQNRSVHYETLSID